MLEVSFAVLSEMGYLSITCMSHVSPYYNCSHNVMLCIYKQLLFFIVLLWYHVITSFLSTFNFFHHSRDKHNNYADIALGIP